VITSTPYQIGGTFPSKLKHVQRSGLNVNEASGKRRHMHLYAERVKRDMPTVSDFQPVIKRLS